MRLGTTQEWLTLRQMGRKLKTTKLKTTDRAAEPYILLSTKVQAQLEHETV
jgi:hypothetical protein